MYGSHTASRPISAGLRFLLVGGAHVAVGLLIAQGLGVRIPMLQAAKPIDTQITAPRR